MVGRRVAHYEILEKLGEGGMGVVYKARDSHLDRFAAIKFLPPEKVADPERKRRFVQEAKAASALNHPNITIVYDIDQADGVDFISMEFVAGKTLDRLIPRNGMPLNQVLKYGVQIADAVAAAHRAGIVHRDLKPANVMVTEGGQVKVLDFGLAKLTDTAEGGEESQTRTIREEDRPSTGEDRIIGTAAYMSPEQAQGKKIDARSDIFSFGSLLYEMITGKRAFEGDSKMSTLGAIIHKEPEPLGSKAPHDLQKVITRCLRRDPERRFQHMVDVKLALEELKEESDSGTLEIGASAKPNPRRRLLMATAVASVAALTLAGIWVLSSRSRTPEAPPTTVPLTSYPGRESQPSFSPDGTQVAFQWCPEQGNCDIYVKQIGVEPPSRLTDTPALEYSAAWSPDGRTIAFLRTTNPAAVSLVLIPQRGGRERVLAEFDFSRAKELLRGGHLAWTPDSKWLVTPVWGVGGKRWGLHLVSVETGQQRQLTSAPADALGDASPAISPDGRTLAFARGSFVATRSDVYLLGLGEGYTPLGEPERVRSDNSWSSEPAWTPDGDEIVFSSGTLYARGLWRVAVSKSSTPRMLGFARERAHAPAIARQASRLAYEVLKFDVNIWRVDLREPGQTPGAPVQFIFSTRRDDQPAYSPDGKRIAFVSDRSGNDEIWICDSDGRNPVQLTSLGADLVRVPRWAPNGESIAFEANPGDNQDVYVVNANGGAPRRLTVDPNPDQWPSWSADGRSLYFVSARGGTKEIWKIPAASGEAVQLTRDVNGVDIPQPSLDGKFLYYSRGYPNPLSIWRMPVEGGEGTKVLDGVRPRGASWTLAERGIYFFSWSDNKTQDDLSVYEFATSKTRKLLSSVRPLYAGIAVSPDQRTVLFAQVDDAGSDIILAENFR